MLEQYEPATRPPRFFCDLALQERPEEKNFTALIGQIG